MQGPTKLMHIRKKYRLAIQTTEHFLGKCPVFYYHRQNHFDTHFTTLAELIKNTNLNKIIKYTIDTKRIIEDVS